MIEGLKVDIPGKEMKHLLSERLAYHKDRLNYWEGQLALLRTTMTQAEKDGYSLGKSSYGSKGPLEAAEESIAKHQNNIVFYKFTSEHVVIDETYRLSEHDLQRIGVEKGH